MKTVVLKMVSGEELVARFDEEKQTHEKVRVFHVMQDPQTGETRAGLMPWLMSAADATLTINPALIVTQVEADLELEKSYLRTTSSLVLQ